MLSIKILIEMTKSVGMDLYEFENRDMLLL